MHPIQTAFIVPDIHDAMRSHGEALGAGPWFLRERGIFARQTYRGNPARTELSIAMAQAGGMLYELIEQHDDGPSVYRDVRALRGFGLHHVGIGAEAYESVCADHAARGYGLAYEAEVAHGARVGYFEKAGLPFMIEVIEMLPASRAMFARFRAAHEAWDGTFAIHPLGPVPETPDA